MSFCAKYSFLDNTYFLTKVRSTLTIPRFRVKPETPKNYLGDNLHYIGSYREQLGMYSRTTTGVVKIISQVIPAIPRKTEISSLFTL